MYKQGRQTIAARLTELIQLFWTKKLIPQDFKDTNLAHLYKNKTDRASFDSHKSISLLSIAGKVMARVLQSCITRHLLDDVVSQRGSVASELIGGPSIWFSQSER